MKHWFQRGGYEPRFRETQPHLRHASLASFREVSEGLRSRLQIAMLIALAAMLFLGGRLWHLQVTQGDYYRDLADNNRVRLRRVRATRGLVFDRSGRVLVENRPSYDVVMVPEDAGNPTEVLQRLSAYLGEEKPDVDAAATMKKRQRKPFEAVVLREDVDWKTLVAVETRQFELPGVSLEIGPRRSYPYGEYAAHLLGYVGEVAKRDLVGESDYQMGDTIGKRGLERFLESTLRGTNGGRQVEIDVVGRETRVLRRVAETPGADVHLTIDIDLQQAAYNALEGREGAIVALDPRDGSVLAMVSRPAFDPNLFADGISHENWERLRNDPLKPLADKARQGLYPPGSVFKIVTAAAALDEGTINPFTRIFCGGSIRFGKRNFNCWKRGGHGWMDVHGSLVESCDVFFYQVAQRLGVDVIAGYAKRFGLGAPTGLEIHNEGGTIPTSEWKRRTRGEPWYSGETLSVAIGQGYVTTTPLQVASILATIGSGGILHQPRLVRSITGVEGLEVDHDAARPVDTGLRGSTLQLIRSALRDAVETKKGTGIKAQLDGIEIAGKTGTSQTVRLRRVRVPQMEMPRKFRDHAWFAGFAPFDDPEIAVAVLVEHAGGGGGGVAAPIARQLLDHYFRNQRENHAED